MSSTTIKGLTPQRVYAALTEKREKNALVYYDQVTDRFFNMFSPYSCNEIDERGLVPIDSSSKAHYLLEKHGTNAIFHLEHSGFDFGTTRLPLAPIEIHLKAFGKALSKHSSASGVIERTHDSLFMALKHNLRQGYTLKEVTYGAANNYMHYAKAA